MYLIDSHCHIHDQGTYDFALSHFQHQNSEYTPDQLLARAHENGIQKLICIGTTHQDSLTAEAFAAQHADVFWSYGIHPDEAGTSPDETDSHLTEALDFTKPSNSSDSLDFAKPSNSSESLDFAKSSNSAEGPNPTANKLVAIGEIGLDYHYGTATREAQIKLLEPLLELAQNRQLPCIFHVREAFDDFFAVLRNFPEIKRAVVHSFSDSEENLRKSLNEGFYIGVNGLATFTNIPLPPLERTLLETDSPFLAPVPHRGEVDEPAFVKNVANFLAIHYQTTLDNVAEITTKNAEQLFRI